MSDPAQLRPALEFAYGESAAWVDLDRLVEEILDPDTDPNDAKRYYLNVAAPSSDWAFDHGRWDELGDGKVPPKGSLIVAGFDGARHDDSTAIVAVDVETGTAWLHAVWEKPEGVDEWTVDEAEVTEAMRGLVEDYDVWRVYCDPAWWTETVAGWESEFTRQGKPVVAEFWANRWRAIGEACKALAGAVRAESIHWVDDDDSVLSHHVKNSVRRNVSARDDEGRQLWTLSKPAPGRKIDAAMALVLAWRARTDAIALGVKKRAPAVIRRIR